MTSVKSRPPWDATIPFPRPRDAPEELPTYVPPVTGVQVTIADQAAQLEDEQRKFRPRHRKHAGGLTALARRHAARFTSFSVIGVAVLVAGIVVQALLVRAGTGVYGSYAGQALFSIEASYFLNRYITWRDRPAGAAAWRRFNVQKIALTVPNVALYAMLVELGAGWLAANLITTAVSVPANYVFGDLWSFAAVRLRSKVRLTDGCSGFPLPTLPLGQLPTVSIVIPCKGNEKTIRATVDSLLGQDYPALAEVICVGDVGDSTWRALADIEDPRLIMIEQEKKPGQRDPNVKRDKGLRKATGDVLALADSDIVMDPGWLSGAIALLTGQGGGLVAGGMRAIHADRYWPRFVDRNAIAAKTSRVTRPYEVTAGNFGARGRKPPLTANAVFTRSMYEACPLDAAWAYGYEDYEWYWRLAKNGHRIQYHGGLTASHHHREKFRQLMREYRRSAQGCAQFVRRHPDSPLAFKRRMQAMVLPVAAVAWLGFAVAAVVAGYWLPVAAAVGVIVTAASAREAVQSRSLHGLAYPFAGALLGGVFTVTLAVNLLRPADRSAPVWDGTTTAATPPVRRSRVPLLIIGAALLLGALVRLWDIGAAPEWQLDEITYSSIAENLIAHGTLNVPLAYGQPFQPFLYHPPFYPYLLSWWFRLAGSGITQARVLGVAAGMTALGLFARLLAKQRGAEAAAFTTVLVAFDGWLIYAGRISYIENTVLVLMMVALNLYSRALRTRRMRDYLIAGVMTGAAAAWNNDAGYLIVVVGVCWLLVRRDHRMHIAALVSALAVVGAYIGGMSWAYTIGGTNWWWHDTAVQLNRITGGQSSAGTLGTPAQFLTLLERQYDLFIPSVLAALAALILLVWRLIRCARERRPSPLGPEMLLPAWAIGAVAVFGPASLHYSQYFVMVLLPLYAYLWVTVWPALARTPRKTLIVAFTAVVAVAGLTSATLRLRQDSNAFAQFRQYAATSIPKGDLVVAGTAGDPIAYVIDQPWCSPGTSLSPYCSAHADYVVTWQTYLQPPNPMHLVSLQLLLDRSKPVAEFRQFSGEIVVWKVTPPAVKHPAHHHTAKAKRGRR